MEEKQLKSGKKITMRELSALDDILSYQLMGKEFDADNVVPTAMTHRYVSAVLALVDVDGKPVMPPKSLADVFAVLADFKAKEWNEVLALYDSLNEDGDSLGE